MPRPEVKLWTQCAETCAYVNYIKKGVKCDFWRSDRYHKLGKRLKMSIHKLQINYSCINTDEVHTKLIASGNAFSPFNGLLKTIRFFSISSYFIILRICNLIKTTYILLTIGQGKRSLENFVTLGLCWQRIIAVDFRNAPFLVY